MINSLPLTLKYRPQSLADVVEQETAIKLVTGYLETNCVMPILIVGPYGCGKTTISRILAAALLNCNTHELDHHIDTVVIDGANTSVLELREKLKLAQYKPIQAKKKIFFIDEFHGLSAAGFNAFLNDLEFIPYNVHFILATSEPDKLPANIISRCFVIEIQNISDEAIMKRLLFICKKSSYTISQKILEIIVLAAYGSLRDAIKYLEQCKITKIQDEKTAAIMLNVLPEDMLNKLIKSFQILDWDNMREAIDEIKISPANALKCLITKMQTNHNPAEYAPIISSLVESFEIIRNGLPGKTLLSIILYKAMYIHSLSLGEEAVNKLRTNAIEKIIKNFV